MEYGSGAVMSVPAHDQRDWEFARKYDIAVDQVIEPVADEDCDMAAAAFTAKGRLINSGEFDGLTSAEAFEQIIAALQVREAGRPITNYRLRDWGSLVNVIGAARFL